LGRVLKTQPQPKEPHINLLNKFDGTFRGFVKMPKHILSTWEEILFLGFDYNSNIMIIIYHKLKMENPQLYHIGDMIHIPSFDGNAISMHEYYTYSLRL